MRIQAARGFLGAHSQVGRERHRWRWLVENGMSMKYTADGGEGVVWVSFGMLEGLGVAGQIARAFVGFGQV